jgi:fibro-slime domain-containing protein
MLIKKNGNLHFIIILMLHFAFSIYGAQNYPETILVPVTYYDFHSDRSNPEFEARHEGGLRLGMVNEELGANGKPQLGSKPYLNYYMSKWFVPWKSGDYTIPDYLPGAEYKQGFYQNDTMHYYDSVLQKDTVKNVAGWEKEFRQPVIYNGNKDVDYDTAFKNVVIRDSLPFRHIGNGMYEYRNDKFFPLDKKGFGNEWNHEAGKNDKNLDVDHNFSFTMELNWSFVKKAGLTFDFNGDDDVFVFLNKKLQIDLGGIHEAQQKSFAVDNITGMANGKTYDLDVFYAERHSAESHIRITTNIIFSPSNLRLYGKRGIPDTEDNKTLGDSVVIVSGSTFAIYGNIFDSLSVWKPEYNKYITWEASNLNGNPALSSTSGDSTVFTGSIPNTSVVVVAHFVNPETGSESERSITVYVRPPYPPKPFVIKFYNSDKDPATLVPITSFSALTGYTTTIYAHVFDSNDVWVPKYDSLVKWSISLNPDGVEISPLEGKFTRVTPSTNGTRKLLAELTDPDNVYRPKSTAEIPFTVVEGPVPSSFEIRFYDTDGDPVSLTPITSVTALSGQSKTIYAHLFDSAGTWLSNYDEKIEWSIIDNGTGSTLLPAAGSHTVVTFVNKGTLTLSAEFQDPYVAARPRTKGKLPVNVSDGPLPSPYRIKFYKEPGDPATLSSISAISGNAGEELTVYAHLFDSANVWLADYDKLIKWSLSGDSGHVSVSNNEGEKVTLSSDRRGYFYLNARFKDPENSKRPETGSELPVTINAGLEDHIQIVTDTATMTLDTNRLIFGSKVNGIQLFGIVRDKFGNFIRYTSLNAQWVSTRSDLVSVSNFSGSTTTLLKNVTYSEDQIQIILNEGSLKPDTVKIEFNGNRSAIATPVPFIPGRSDIKQILPPSVLDFYDNIIRNLPTTKVVLVGISTEGVLIPLNPSDTLLQDLSKVSFGKVRIYDGVGNLVRTGLPLLRARNSRSYAVVWDGTNTFNRIVGIGAYLVDIRGREKRKDGRFSDFTMRVKVGVKSTDQ